MTALSLLAAGVILRPSDAESIVISYAVLRTKVRPRRPRRFSEAGLTDFHVASAPVALASIAHGDSQINTGSRPARFSAPWRLNLVFIAGL
jgi:hypothetical protein